VDIMRSFLASGSHNMSVAMFITCQISCPNASAASCASLSSSVALVLSIECRRTDFLSTVATPVATPPLPWTLEARRDPLLDAKLDGRPIGDMSGGLLRSNRRPFRRGGDRVFLLDEGMSSAECDILPSEEARPSSQTEELRVGIAVE